jgi:hypothetical protein
MAIGCRSGALGLILFSSIGLACISPAPSSAQTDRRDGIADLINREAGTAKSRLAQNAPKGTASPQQNASEAAQPAQPGDVPQKDPREGDATFEQAKRLMMAIDGLLQDAAKDRSAAKRLPSKDQYLVTPLWTETREDRERRVRDLLDAALGIVTDVPIVDVQRRIEERRRNIREIEERIVRFKEKQVTAPKDGLLPGVLSDTVDSLARDIADNEKRIATNRDEISAAKAEIVAALAKSGIKLAPDQVDLLLDSVLSGDLVRLVAVFNSAKLVDQQLSRMMSAAGDNINAARKYFAMHAALFAMLVHAQDTLIGKIDTNYLPKLEAITKDIGAARTKTIELLKAENRPDQLRALEANRESQKVSDATAKGYRRYVLQQREQIAAARRKAVHDLMIADNTYETVEASFQLRNLMRDSNASFEAIQKLEAPTFEQIFKNEELRREFENLTRKLDAPSG